MSQKWCHRAENVGILCGRRHRLSLCLSIEGKPTARHPPLACGVQALLGLRLPWQPGKGQRWFLLKHRHPLSLHTESCPTAGVCRGASTGLAGDRVYMGEKTQLPRQFTPGTCSPAPRPGKAERRPGVSGEGEGAGQWRRCWGDSWNVKWGVGAVRTELGDRRG